MTSDPEEIRTALADMHSYLSGALIMRISSIAPNGSDLESAVAALRQVQAVLGNAITEPPEHQLTRKQEAVMHCQALKTEIEQFILYLSSPTYARQKTPHQYHQYPHEIYATAEQIVFLLSDELA